MSKGVNPEDIHVIIQWSTPQRTNFYVPKHKLPRGKEYYGHTSHYLKNDDLYDNGVFYLTGGFKKPRELTWVTGVILASVTVSFGVTGYSLPWDQVGYWACKIVTGVPNAIPVVGDSLVELLRGGSSVGQATLTRFYSLHTFVLPLITAVLMLAHFLMIRKQGISGPL